MVKSLDPRALVERLGEAFQHHSSRGKEVTPPSRVFDIGVGALAASSLGVLDDVPAYTIKVETQMPGRSPSISGLLHLYDAESGQLLALMESSHISSLGSALTGALATDLLAVPEAGSLAVVGNGTLGWLGLRFLMEMRPVEEVTLFDLSRRKCRRIAERLKKYEGLKVRVCDSLTEAVCNADIVWCATWADRPFLFSEMVKPGAHISTLGADGKGKSELSVELLESSSFFCDDRDLAVSSGPLRGVKKAKSLVKAELGDILSGREQGRKSEEEVTVYGAVGLPFVDLIAAWEVYRKARRKKVGRAFAVWD